MSLQATATLAAGAQGSGHAFIGKAGDASSVTRTVKIVMHDNYFDMENLSVKRGETIRFVITNAGQLVHEFNIGTKAMHAAHGEEMLTMMQHGALESDKINHDKMKMDMKMDIKMDMKMDMAMRGGETMRHDDANSVLLEPGKSAKIVWKFPDTATVQLEFACNIPGHYDAGMVGKVHFPKLIS